MLRTENMTTHEAREFSRYMHGEQQAQAEALKEVARRFEYPDHAIAKAMSDRERFFRELPPGTAHDAPFVLEFLAKLPAMKRAYDEIMATTWTPTANETRRFEEIGDAMARTREAERRERNAAHARAEAARAAETARMAAIYAVERLAHDAKMGAVRHQNRVAMNRLATNRKIQDCDGIRIVHSSPDTDVHVWTGTMPDGKVAGHVNIIDQPRENRVYVEYLVTRGTGRRCKNLSLHLLRIVEQWARRKHRAYVWLVSLSHARRFYARAGYGFGTERDVMPGTYESDVPPTNVTHMAKYL